ncbi:hypothetical protein RhiirA5_499805 [Rhizophagus irregularis]|uniref:Uncharacterized protein n=2 Tax=Rhizophagus irregularis TaxID=588596 RepID=A0A2N0PPB3_9GLOM|nr:hypothetical protein RhiirA5_499805 [Rhizophagus irregularis]PKK78852.1 hypothetical protein RhiirC2_728675 [Rhizophagus irregularis]
MPRADRMKRWDYTELVKVLKFLNNNFNKWFENHMEACTAASKNTNIDRDASSIYSKVHTLIKDMENSIEADRSPTCNILRESKKISKLVRKICIKTRERTERTQIKESQEKKINRKSGGDFKVNIETNQVTTAGETSTNQMNQMGSFQMPIVIEEVKTLCNERIQGIETKRKEDIEKISQIQSEMIETLMDANNKINNKCEELKQYQ